MPEHLRGPREQYNVGLSDEEFSLLIDMIDEEEVDEDAILGLRKKLYEKRRMLRRRTARRNGSASVL